MVALRKEDVYVTPGEYLAGVVHAMSGGTTAHDRISGSIYSELRAQLRGRPCEAFTSNMKVRVRLGEAEFFYYPDVSVDCSHTPDLRQVYLEEPSVIFEVLSPSAERIDKGEKLSNYAWIPSLKVYGLVDQFRPAVTIHRRTTEGWHMEFSGSIDDTLALPEIDCSLPLTAIYERMGF